MKRRKERQLQGELYRIFKEVIRERGQEGIINAVIEEGRSDILLVKAKTGKPIFSLELKDPLAPDGKTVFHPETFTRELERARKLGCDAFGISNFIETAIFSLECPSSPCEWILEKGNALSIPQIESYRKNLRVTPDIEEGLRKIAHFVLDNVLQILEGKIPRLKPLDERFIYKLKSLIEVYVPDLVYSLKEKYAKDQAFRSRLNRWFRDQLWTIPSSDEDFEKVAHIALLMLVSKLIFYKSLYDTKVYSGLPKLVIHDTVDSPSTLKDYLFEEYFKPLVDVTGDFENLIGDPSDVLNEIPFITNTAVDFVKSVVHSEDL